MIDYRQLLMRYMRHVMGCVHGGVGLAEKPSLGTLSQSTSYMTDEDWEELDRLTKEVLAEERDDAC